ncbi:MAG: hypothetical protein J6X69_04375 [Bacteroidales bacterium]|nr:hypothetical protein [Bacteroidales bacterium]
MHKIFGNSPNVKICFSEFLPFNAFSDFCDFRKKCKTAPKKKNFFSVVKLKLTRIVKPFSFAPAYPAGNSHNDVLLKIKNNGTTQQN